jgi:putative transposase
MVAAAIRTIFAQPDAEHVRGQLDTVAGMLGRQLPKVESMLRDAAADITAFADFPVPHWKKIWSTNPGTAQQRGQTPYRRRRRLSQLRRAATTGRLRARRSPRRMASRRQTLPETTRALLQPASDAGDQSVAIRAAITA